MSNIKPAGYLNKFTGLIWNPEQQPGADSEPEIYETLVRLSDVHGLVAENAAMRKSINGVLTHCPINDPDIDKACSAMICNDALESTPATDAAIAEIREQSVIIGIDFVRNMLIDYVEREAGPNRNVPGLIKAAEKCVELSDSLRAGRKG